MEEQDEDEEEEEEKSGGDNSGDDERQGQHNTVDRDDSSGSEPLDDEEDVTPDTLLPTPGNAVEGIFSEVVDKAGAHSDVYGMGMSHRDKLLERRRRDAMKEERLTTSTDDFRRYGQQVLDEKRRDIARRHGGASILRILFDSETPLELKPRLFQVSRPFETWSVLDRRAVHAVWDELELRNSIEQKYREQLERQQPRNLTQLELKNDVLVGAVVEFHEHAIHQLASQGDGHSAAAMFIRLGSHIRALERGAQIGAACIWDRMEQLSLLALRAFLIAEERRLPQNDMGQAVDVEQMEAALGQMAAFLRRGPTVDHYNTLAEAHILRGNVDRAEQLLHSELMSAGRHNETTIGLLIRCHCMKAQWARALSLMSEQGRQGEGVLLDCLYEESGQRNSEWKRTARRVLTAAPPLADKLDIGRLKVAIALRDAAAARTFYERLQSTPHAPEALDLYVPFMFEMGQCSSAIDLVNQAIVERRCTAVCYNALLLHLLDTGQYGRMDEVRSSMVKSGVAPTSITIQTLVRALLASSGQGAHQGGKKGGRGKDGGDHVKKRVDMLVKWGISKLSQVEWDLATVQLIARVNSDILRLIARHQDRVHSRRCVEGKSRVHPLDRHVTRPMLSRIVKRQNSAALARQSKRTRVTRIMHSAETKLRRAVVDGQLEDMLLLRWQGRR